MDAESGSFAVRAARSAILAETEGKEQTIEFPDDFDQKRGVFVTLKTFSDMELRGCIGYPEPILPLKEALVLSARAACHDPRFPDLRRSEVDGCVVEVTVLTPPRPIIVKSKDELPGRIVIGKDGLIIDMRGRRGLLLPQVPKEYGWDTTEYLAQLSVKAGLPYDAWMRKDSEISSFEGEIFSETTPNGEIRQG